MRQQKSLTPDKPFFVYFAPGATHAPHHVPPGWADRYDGQFDDGWDALRDRIFQRQKELGVIPPEAQLTARHEEIPAWEDMPEELKAVLARQMEIYAGFLEHTDHHVGRLLDALEELEILEDTLVYYIIGDNGASAEGTLNGSFNENIIFNGAPQLETAELMAAHIDDFGTPRAYNHYAVGWAHALDTPYQWTKQVASHWGGTRNGLVVHWPRGVEARGEIRSQFHHVIDVTPTILEVAGVPQPTEVYGIPQQPIEGVSMAYSFGDASAAERRGTQYFEVFCNRGIYHQGWTAVTRHSTPWVIEPLPAFDDDVWELYDTNTDWSQAHDLAAEMPEKVAQLQQLWLEEAKKHNVLPLDDRRIERFDAALAGRPQLVHGNSQVLFGGMGRLTESSVLNIKNRSHSVTAEIVVPESGAQGVIVAQGGAFGGWVLYTRGGQLTYCHNFIGLRRFTVEGEGAVAPGTRQVRMEFDYDGGGPAKGGTVSLYVDGARVGESRVEATVPLIFSGDETTDLGHDSASPVSDDYTPEESVFTGTVNWVQIDIDEAAADVDHLISPEERLRVAMARQ
jgi:arylsulfatase